MTTGEQTLAKLAAHKLKKAGANEWRCNSPLRSGSDSGAFSLHIDDDGEHGTWHDHVSGESGSLYQLAERLGIEVPKAQAQETKRAYQSLADYVAAHYAPVEAFTAAGWQEGTHKDRPCLIYKVGGKLRYRYLDGNPDKAAYEWEPGGKPAWYGLKHAPDMAKGRALVLCNGEASTISAQHHGVPACAWAGGEKKLPDHAITELKAAYTGPIIIAYDCDETGQRRVSGFAANSASSCNSSTRAGAIAAVIRSTCASSFAACFVSASCGSTCAALTCASSAAASFATNAGSGTTTTARLSSSA